VQGYKFNIFYPDLLNPTEAPRYFFENDPNGSRDTMILRFNAGPPYEDIAFRCPRSVAISAGATANLLIPKCCHAAEGYMASRHGDDQMCNDTIRYSGSAASASSTAVFVTED